MKKLLILAFAFLALTADASAQGSVQITMQNDSNGHVLVRFYSRQSNHVWPAYNRAYNLPNDQERRSFNLSCRPGQHICYGAWVANAPRTIWGVGQSASNGCRECCFYCEAGDVNVPRLTGY